MAEHDESLEVGIAAGLDIPTALVLSGQADPEHPRYPTAKAAGDRAVLVAVIIGVVATAIVCWLPYCRFWRGWRWRAAYWP